MAQTPPPCTRSRPLPQPAGRVRRVGAGGAHTAVPSPRFVAVHCHARLKARPCCQQASLAQPFCSALLLRGCLRRTLGPSPALDSLVELVCRCQCALLCLVPSMRPPGAATPEICCLAALLQLLPQPAELWCCTARAAASWPAHAGTAHQLFFHSLSIPLAYTQYCTIICLAQPFIAYLHRARAVPRPALPARGAHSFEVCTPNLKCL